MQPHKEDRTLYVHGAQSKVEFDLDPEDLPQIFNILRNSLYSNKILAVLREYGANAWDANRENNKGDVPISIMMPNRLEASVTIRDYGKGLSENDIYKVYAYYGKSTKRHTNSAVGHFGIGAKSGFAYNDTFSITSYHGGMKTLYNAVIDESDRGIIMKMHEEPCPLEETGLEVKIPIHENDIPEFYKEASNLFGWFYPLPSITEVKLINKRENNRIIEGKGFIDRGYGDWICVMGIIPYKLDIEKLKRYGIEIPPKFIGVLLFEIGDLETTASREEIEYKPKTLEKIALRIEELTLSMRQAYEDVIKKANIASSKELYIEACALVEKYNYIPADLKASIEALTVSNRSLNLLEYVDIINDKGESEKIAKSVLMTTEGKKSLTVHIQDQAILYIDSAKGPIQNYALNFYRFECIKPCPGVDIKPDEAIDFLKKRLKESKLDGIEIILLSAMDSYYKAPIAKLALPEYTKKLFVQSTFMGQYLGAHSWKIYALTDEDRTEVLPYVILDRFRPRDYDPSQLLNIKTINAALDDNRPFPTKLIGIKKSMPSDKIQKMKEKDGFNLISLAEWIEHETKSLRARIKDDMLDVWRLMNLICAVSHYERSEVKLDIILRTLPSNHEVAILAKKLKAYFILAKNSPDRKNYEIVKQLISDSSFFVHPLVTSISSRYPLLDIKNILSSYERVPTNLLLEYVQLVDQVDELERGAKSAGYYDLEG